MLVTRYREADNFDKELVLRALRADTKRGLTKNGIIYHSQGNIIKFDSWKNNYKFIYKNTKTRLICYGIKH